MKKTRTKPQVKAKAQPSQKCLTASQKISHSRFRLLAENIGDVLWFKELNPLRIAYVSPAFEKIWGISTAELYEQPTLWEDSIHPEDRQLVRTAMQQWFDSETNDCQIEYRVLHANGEIRWLVDRGFIIGRENGRTYQISGITHDITKNKEEEILRARLAAVVESSDDAIISLDLAGAIQTWNSGAERIFGYSKSEAVGKPVAFLRPLEAADDETIFLEHIRKGKRIHHYETKRQRKDGQIIDVSLALSPLRDSSGKITGFSKISRDITEHKLANQRFHDLFEAAPDALIMVNSQGIIQMVNAQALRLFGYSSAGLIGQQVEKLVSKSQRAHHKKLRQKFLETPENRERFRGLEMIGRCQDGKEFPMEINLSQIENPQGTYIISDIIDITQRKQAEKAIMQLNAELEMRVADRTADLLRANEELHQLIAMRRQLEEEILRISEHEQRRIGQDLHDDLGQQLAGAWMMSSVLERNLNKKSAPDAPAAAGISSLLEKALAQTRSLARGLHPVSAVDGGLMSALEELAARNSSMFGIDCRWECLETIQIDDDTTATHLYRIAQEAVSNAVKHGRAKIVRIQFTCDSESVILKVLDNGKGIAKSNSGKHGMGLRIMRYRADMIQATLTLENAKSGGTDITCIIPTSTIYKDNDHGKKSNVIQKHTLKKTHPHRG